MKFMKKLRLILGDQLNADHSWYREDDKNCIYLLMEMRQETDYVRHHIQKLLGVLTAMRRFAAFLRSRNKRVLYINLEDPENMQQLDDNLLHVMKQHEIGRFEYQLPDEYRLDNQLKDFCTRISMPHQACDTEHFLTGREELGELFREKKRFLMESFYRRMRKRYDFLMEQGKPKGGKWNFDRENRSGWKKGFQLPEPLLFANDCSAVHRGIRKSGVDFFGSVEPQDFPWPVDRGQALSLLEHFVGQLLPLFGTYQDAMTAHSWSLYHSRLSFALNIKLLHPLQVVQRALEEWEKRKGEISLPQIEGFIRQIMGWREYMRGVYWAAMPDFASCNFFEHSRPLPGYFWTGNTKMHCMSAAIEQSLKWAYAHHIQRLMITGNFALLAGLDVDEVDRWYLGIYIDAIQWVEITNTRGMSQFADGGLVATKPYAGSASYIHRMSDYCEHCHYDYRKRHGQKSCPFNSLYWHFFHRHREKLRGNPRLGITYKNLDRMDGEERGLILQQAEQYLDHLEEL
jgi:deoxyribodipyrimidine photolyase-related protein